jgi:hypothetical protein
MPCTCSTFVSHRPRSYRRQNASGDYVEVCGIAYRGEGLLEAAPRLMPLVDGDGLPVALLRAEDWANLPPITTLSHEPQFPPLRILLSSLLGTWLQEPYSKFSSRLSTWITSIYDVRADPALVEPVKGGALEPYSKLARTIPARVRQLHVDLVHERVFMMAYATHFHYSAVAEAVDQCVASMNDPDSIDVPPPSVEEIGMGNKPGFWYV